ncbi:MAG: M17 family peptidase N-terminal domain-containing protein, partial [Desulfatiglandales bacterium]
MALTPTLPQPPSPAGFIGLSIRNCKALSQILGYFHSCLDNKTPIFVIRVEISPAWRVKKINKRFFFAVWRTTGTEKPRGATGAIDKALNGQIQTLIASGDFQGKNHETLVLYPNGAIPAKRVIVVGLGKSDKFTLDIARQAASSAAQKAHELGVTRLHTILHGVSVGGLTPEQSAEAIVEGT